MLMIRNLTYSDLDSCDPEVVVQYRKGHTVTIIYNNQDSFCTILVALKRAVY